MDNTLYLRNEQLARCEVLKQRGFPQKIEAGTHVSRGFADLGYEQFIVLPAGTLLSLFTGDRSTLLDEHRQFFFCVPTVDTFCSFLQNSECEVTCMLKDNECAVSISSERCSYESLTTSLWDCLLECCLAVLETTEQ